MNKRLKNTILLSTFFILLLSISITIYFAVNNNYKFNFKPENNILEKDKENNISFDKNPNTTDKEETNNSTDKNDNIASKKSNKIDNSNKHNHIKENSNTKKEHISAIKIKYSIILCIECLILGANIALLAILNFKTKND